MTETANPKKRHFTTRPGFTICVGLLVLSLYVVWASYGAAPTSLRFLVEAQNNVVGHMTPGGHGATAGGMSPEKFREITEKFVEEFSLPDGSVRPMRRRTASMAAMGGGHVDRKKVTGEQGHGKTAAKEHQADAMKSGEAAHTESSAEKTAPIAGEREQKEAQGHDESEEPIDVYLMAMQFSYSPRVLRLKRGVPYRFRMMSVDVNHGVSIHTGFAGHIMRRPARRMVDMVMTFPNSGEYMMYCTVYCGQGHSQMKGKIIVE